MKNLVLTLISIILTLTLTLTACSSSPNSAPSNAEPTPMPIIKITPEQAFSADNAQSIVNYPVTVSNTSDNSVIYHSSPIGQGDTVTVTVSQYSDTQTKERIRADYDKVKSMRPSAETLENIGDDAYIAYPAVHVYIDGYHVSVAAGSGGDESQRNLLVGIAGTVAENLNNILSGNTQ